MICSATGSAARLSKSGHFSSGFVLSRFLYIRFLVIVFCICWRILTTYSTVYIWGSSGYFKYSRNITSFISWIDFSYWVINVLRVCRFPVLVYVPFFQYRYQVSNIDDLGETNFIAITAANNNNKKKKKITPSNCHCCNCLL